MYFLLGKSLFTLHRPTGGFKLLNYCNPTADVLFSGTCLVFPGRTEEIPQSDGSRFKPRTFWIQIGRLDKLAKMFRNLKLKLHRLQSPEPFWMCKTREKLSTHLWICVPSGFIPWGFPTKIFCFIFFPIHAASLTVSYLGECKGSKY